MEKEHEDPASLTSFNMIAEGDGEGLISKFFSKFKTAVSGPQSSNSGNRTITLVVSNDSDSIHDMVLEESTHEEEDQHIDSSDTIPHITTPLPQQNDEELVVDTIPLQKTSSCDSDTQSVMTTFSVSNSNSLSKILNRLRGESESNKEFWMPDEQCRECVSYASTTAELVVGFFVPDVCIIRSITQDKHFECVKIAMLNIKKQMM
ncbi:hypothetical protein K501DRAFT_267210 [Backusella circina FSU 941]|nr:hypothetical protein K501DRAFT_267210 [Backusella circina FSU 941]